MSSDARPHDDREVMISVRGLSKSYTIRHDRDRATTLAEAAARRLRKPFGRAPSDTETFWALRDVSFDVKRGDVVGVIGRNGAGKSTLLKILSRITGPTAGKVDLYGRVGSLLEVGTGFHPELTGRENVYLNGAILGMTRPDIRRQFDAIVDFAGTERFLDTPVKRYSSGMYVRLAFAVAAHLRCEVLIVDEVLAVGDAQFQEKCLGKMRDVSKGGRTVLFVSHNTAAIKTLCNVALYLVSGQMARLGSVEHTLNEYLGSEKKSSFSPEFGPLKHLSVKQSGNLIVIDGHWSSDNPISVPNLGVVIYDQAGAPITGVSPVVANFRRFNLPKTAGRIVGRLTQPRLFDGQYHVSVWFGDESQNFVEFSKCITIDIAGMGGDRQLSSSTVGSVFPECTWESFDS